MVRGCLPPVCRLSAEALAQAGSLGAGRDALQGMGYYGLLSKMVLRWSLPSNALVGGGDDVWTPAGVYPVLDAGPE